MPSKFGYSRKPFARSEMLLPSSKLSRGNNSFSDWYRNASKHVDYLNKLLSENDDPSDYSEYENEDFYPIESLTRCRGGALMPNSSTIDSMSKFELRESFRKAQDQLSSLYGENKTMREMMSQATDYGKMQLMAAEIQMLKEERDRLRDSLGKVVQIEGKIVEYKQQACMARKYQVEAENLRKELELMNQKLSNNALDYKNQMSDVELQLRITQKERNEYRNKAERLQLQNDVLRNELAKSKDSRQTYLKEYPLHDRNPRIHSELVG